MPRAISTRRCAFRGGGAPLLALLSPLRHNTAKAFDAIRARAAAHGIPAEMLEYTEGSDGDLHEDLTVVGAAAWQQYSIGQSAGAWPARRATRLPLR